MVVPFIFENEVYTKNSEPYLWVFYKFADLCINNNLPIIAEEAYFQKPSYFRKMNHPASEVMDFYHITDERLKKLNGFKITKSEKKQIVNQYQDDFECWVSLIKEKNEILEGIIEKLIQKIEKKHGKIDAFIVWTWLPSIDHVARKNHIRVINMEASAVREPSYNMLLTYFQFQNKYDCTGINEKFQDLMNEKDVLMFSRKELFTIFASKENLKYLETYDETPKYKVGYALGIKTDCFTKVYSSVDYHKVLKRLSKNIDSKQISVRSHPADPIDVEKMGYSSDKSKTLFEWILSCENIVCDISNIGLDALLLGKNLISLSDRMPTSFQKVTDLSCFDSYQIDDRKLNFLLFYWYVPEKLTQDYEYIKWRLTNPTVKEIYDKHLEYILSQRNISKNELSMIFQNKIDYVLQTIEIKNEVLQLQKQKSIQDNKINFLGYERDILQNELDQVLHSKSWKLTKPLRYIMSIGRK